ncbi:Nramp family divalent metal transporter [Patescibacteria group bacterium]|nr:Nramp family divalent metal transporter [Patescibacteria group bacterium]
MQKIETKPFPKAPKLRYLIGPSFILIGLGLGSGEVILWPYLASNYGMGIIWAAVLGITFQFFMNMEIERYALVKGESVFVGFNRLWKGLPYWFIITSFLGFGWPGMSAASAVLIGKVFGIEANTHYIAIALLVATGLLFTLGPSLYKVVESFQKWIILISVPFITVITIILAKAADWSALGQGLVGIGDGYAFVPEGIALAVFLSAFAYAGAGGNLNLAQSLYIKDKGYGMGKYAGKIKSIITGKSHAQVSAESQVQFEMNESNVANFKIWWRRINAEHALVFWLTGAFTMTMLAFLAFITSHKGAGVAEGINFILLEGDVISSSLAPIIGIMFLLIGGVMLLSTQIGVFEACSRIIVENIAIRRESCNKNYNMSKMFYITLWAFIAFGAIVMLLGFNEPRALIVLGAVINAFAMLAHLVLTYILNRRELKKVFQPVWYRKAIIWVEIAFFAVFSAIVFWDKVIR